MKPLLAKPLVALAAFAAIGAGAATAVAVNAQTLPSTTASQGTPQFGRGMHNGVFGTIAAVNGTTITVTGRNGTTYTVDVSNAKILKASQGAAPAAATAASLAVGDTVAVRGTVNGTALTATRVMDGAFFGAGMMGQGRGHGRGPGVMGIVTAVNGNTLTVTGRNGTTYTVNAGNAKVSKVVDLSVSDIKVGDTIGAQGALSGTSLTAIRIMDGVPNSSNAPPAQSQAQ